MRFEDRDFINEKKMQHGLDQKNTVVEISEEEQKEKNKREMEEYIRK